MPRGTMISVRAQHVDLWRDKAQAEGIPLNAWISKACDEATKGDDVTNPGPCPHHFTAQMRVCVDCRRVV